MDSLITHMQDTCSMVYSTPATLFVSKFFGQRDLMSFISSIPENMRHGIFFNLSFFTFIIFEKCFIIDALFFFFFISLCCCYCSYMRIVNPVNDTIGLLWTSNFDESTFQISKEFFSSFLAISEMAF